MRRPSVVRFADRKGVAGRRGQGVAAILVAMVVSASWSCSETTGGAADGGGAVDAPVDFVGDGLVDSAAMDFAARRDASGGDLSVGRDLSVRPGCANGQQTGDETDVDCGGSCSPCAAGRVCRAARDCASRVCAQGRCSAPTCQDGVENGDESDVDCGGRCPACAEGRRCGGALSCQQGACIGGVCNSGGVAVRRFTVPCPHAATVGDVTGDGKPDIVVGVACLTGYSFRVLQGLGNGDFQIGPVFRFGPQNGGTGATWPIITADVNRDGRLDLVTGDALLGKVFVLTNRGGGGWAQTGEYKVSDWVERIVAGDFDGDGDVDLAVGDAGDATFVLRNRGDGTFSAKQEWPDHCPDLAPVDMDRDGTVDLVLTTDRNILVARKGLTQLRKYPIPQAPREIAAADVDRDGWSDVIGRDLISGRFFLALGDRQGGVAPPRWLFDWTGDRFLVADLNGDGKVDVVEKAQLGVNPGCSLGPCWITAWRGDGNGGFGAWAQVATTLPQQVNGYELAAGDLDGDGRAEVVTLAWHAFQNPDGEIRVLSFK